MSNCSYTSLAVSFNQSVGIGLCLVCCLIGGCSSGSTGATVSGKVTLDGVPLEQGKVRGIHEGGDVVSGEIDGGTFTLSRREGTGIAPGKYQVVVIAYANSSEAKNNPEARLQLLVPKRYTEPSRSGLSFSVNAEEVKEIQFELETM